MIKEISKTHLDFLYLLHCSLHETAPDSARLAAMDLESVYRLARFHSLDAVCFHALKSANNLPDSNLLTLWRESCDRTLRRNLLFEVASSKLYTYMEQQNIWYMPLKGAVLKDLYPGTELRGMADRDILFDAKYADKIKEFFLSEGFDVDSYGHSTHDVYTKKPILNFEMHRTLFREEENLTLGRYYKNIKEKLIPTENSNRFSFTDEDFYIFFIAHANKHFEGFGTGIRTLVDCYLYLANHPLNSEPTACDTQYPAPAANCATSRTPDSLHTMNSAYLTSELETLGLTDFEGLLRSTSEKLFAPESFDFTLPLNEDESAFLAKALSAGTHGTIDYKVEKKLGELQKSEGAPSFKSKFIYSFRRVFPPLSFYKAYYPWAYKYKILIPACIVFRLFRGIFFKTSKMKKEVKLVWKSK